MSKALINSESLNTEIDIFLKHFFKEINLLEIFKNNIWIAGGFARIIAHKHFNLNKEEISKVASSYLLSEFGDIDLFTISEKNYRSCIYEVINGKFKSRLNRNLNKNYVLSEIFDVFSKTFWFDFNGNRSRNTPNTIKVQFVNKFFYNSIENCLNSFDFTNCKYGIGFKDEKFFITYDKNAIKYDKENKLNLEHCKSPLFAKRIIKYIKTKKLEGLFESEHNKNILKEFYYKAITKNWDSVFLNNMENSTFNIENLGIKRLSNIINMSKEDLIIFLGKLSTAEYTKSTSSYGHYFNYIGEKDWATSMLKEEF